MLDGWWEGRANPDGALGVGFEILLTLNVTGNLFWMRLDMKRCFWQCVSNASGLPYHLQTNTNLHCEQEIVLLQNGHRKFSTAECGFLSGKICGLFKIREMGRKGMERKRTVMKHHRCKQSNPKMKYPVLDGETSVEIYAWSKSFS